MTGTEISYLLWAVTNTAVGVGFFWKLKSDVRHLDDTKETKNGLGKNVEEIKLSLTKIETKLEFLPCLNHDSKKNTENVNCKIMENEVPNGTSD